ncbi:uncharacterized protein [Leuresthes tenuis]|uniref:uncharacterized protein isoform X1 n=1 Tax=Leuresthes tenuis TaxID=355514 RepID=UPI003B501B6A
MNKKQSLNFRTSQAEIRTILFFYCLLYAALTEGAEINIEGYEGGEVSFKCSHKLAHNNNKYFCNDPCNSNEDILVTVESDGRAESGRITLVDSGNGVFTVMIRHLQLADSRGYFCAVQRVGLDTYTSVYLTVHKAVTTTSVPVVSSTWTYQNRTNSTKLTTGMATSYPTSLSTATNFTYEEEKDITVGTVLYATFGTIAVFTILILVVCFRKCSSKDPSSMHGKEVDSQYEDDKRVRAFESISVISNFQRQDPQATGGTECNVALHIYENVPAFKGTMSSSYSSTDHQNDHDTTSRIYINPLPFVVSEKRRDDGKQMSRETPKSRAKNAPSPRLTVNPRK